jgi:two-component system, response regulator
MSERELEILLVEDNPNDVELTLRALRRNNLANQVHVARDGAEALDFMFAEGDYTGRDIERRPKVMLLDLMLPKVSGLEVLQRIRSDERTKDIAVVVLTSSKEAPDIAECYELGVNRYIVKPVDFEEFIQVISELGLYWLLLNQPPRYG